MSYFALALSLFLLAQAPGTGWIVSPGPPREVKRVFWDVFQTTEVWVRLTPSDPSGTPPLLSLVFQAFFPGRAEREPHTVLPQWPKGQPNRLVVRAEPFPLTVIRGLSLRFVLDDITFDMTGPGSRYSLLPCAIGVNDCAPTIVEAELPPSLLRALTVARTVRGEALGFPIQLVAADQRALSEFTERAAASAKDPSPR